MPCSTTHFLKVSVRGSLKVATNGLFRGKRPQKVGSFDFKEKRKSVIKVIYVSLII